MTPQIPRRAQVLSRYIDLMTTEGAHNDTYAGTAHRMFFANHVKGVKPTECADNDWHNTVSPPPRAPRPAPYAQCPAPRAAPAPRGA